MHLARVHIENFRAVRKLTLDLDPVTVVIAENNHGKTSLVDVLGLCLGSPGNHPGTPLLPSDFHRPPGGKEGRILVRLSFEHSDHQPRESLAADLFDQAMVRDRDGVRRLHISFTAHPGASELTPLFVNEKGRPLRPQPDDTTLLWVRRLHPVLVIRFADPHPAQGENGAMAPEAAFREDADAFILESAIARVYHRLSEVRGPVPPGEFTASFHAARELADRMESRSPGSGALLHGLVNQLAHQVQPGGPRAGGGSHTLALLLVLGAVLDVRGDSSLPADAQPILALEEPEAHLHPMLLASTWDIIEGIRAQKVVTTNSGAFLSEVPLHFLRRLIRQDGHISTYRLRAKTLTADRLRRVRYHIRAKQGGALFARCWILVEGETEFWVMRGMARILGYDLEAEGVHCVEFAQCGVEPLAALANDLGIQWHLLADGDDSGKGYVEEARSRIPRGSEADRHITQLHHRDMERLFWHSGYADVYRKAAGLPSGKKRKRNESDRPPRWVIGKAIRKRSKPYLALSVVEECERRGAEGVPKVLRRVIHASVALARAAVDDDTVELIEDAEAGVTATARNGGTEATSPAPSRAEEERE
ncbi:MAG: ATP-dependent endonuclease [Gemmatimonadota bacterium]